MKPQAMKARTAQPAPTVETVKDFWQSHVNNEYYTDEKRASEAYFR
jgi:hypothetical protein